MAGKQSWDSPQVKAVFNKWRELFPYYSEGTLGLTWQDGAAQLENKQAGMFLLGGFLTGAMKPANAKDVDFFPFPVINPRWGQDSIDAPIDGYMISKSPKNLAGAKKLVGFLGTAPAIDAYLKINSGNLGSNRRTNTVQVLAAAEEGGEADRRDQAHRPVHGPRHTARLRLDRDDPVAAELHQRPGQQHPQARAEHREAEEGDLRDMTQ